MNDPSSSVASWRFDRRTFLKLLGIGGVGLVTTGLVGSTLNPFATTRVAAASGAVDEMALALQFDTERIFRFVSEQIRYEPYAGVLRGAGGTLMARAGNAADQAVLLAALLNASGVETRFAWGALEPATAEAIVRSGVTDIVTGRLQLIEALSGTGEGARPITPPDLDAENAARLEEAISRAPGVLDWARAQATVTASELEEALRSAGLVLPTGFPELSGAEHDRHLWVQMLSGPTWLDLDPSLPGAVPGDVATTTAEVVDAIPDELRHTIRLRVIEETAPGGALAERTLLEVSDYADALGGLPISVFNLDFAGVKALGVTIAGLLEGGTTYVPSVSLGESVFVGPGWFRIGMSAEPGPFDTPAGDASASQAPAGLSDVFGGAAAEPTAEWIETTLSSPGAEPVTIRRELFDRLGPAARSAGPVDVSSLAPAELVELEPGAPPEYLPAQRVHLLTVHNGIVGGDALGAALTAAGTDKILAGLVHAYHVVREGTGAEVAMPEGIRPFVDAPNLVSFTVVPEQTADGSLAIRPMIDIWHRSFAALPVADTVPTLSPLMLAGVTSHIAERLMFGEAALGEPEPGANEPTGSVSVGAVFDAARVAGIPLRVVQDADAVASLTHPPDVLARLRESVATGRVAIVPEAPVSIAGADRTGWWLVDPVTGATADQLDDGRGATAFENTVIISRRTEDAWTFKRLGACAAFTFGFAAGILNLIVAGMAPQTMGASGIGLSVTAAAIGLKMAGGSAVVAVEAGCAV